MGGNEVRIMGQSFESQLEELLHPAYHRDGIALVWKTPVSSRRIRKHGEIRIIQQQTRPDFCGCLTGVGGRHVEFDAKATGRSLQDGSPVYRHSSQQKHQCQTLWELHQAGGVAFLLVNWINPEDNLDGRGWMLWPQENWADDRSFSVRLEEVGEDIATPVPAWGGIMFSYIPDWYSVVHEKYRRGNE